MADDLPDVREEPDAGAGDDLLHRLDQRAADQEVRADLGGDPRRGKRGLLALGHHLEMRRVAVAADVLHQRGQLVARQAHVLASDVPHAGVGDRRVHVPRVRQGLVVARQHEDELDHRTPKL